MTGALIDVSVLTVTYNSGAFIDGFLSSVYACDLDGIALQVVVVDNGSTDETLALLANRLHKVEVIRSATNSYTRALNLGIAQCRGAFVVIANNDGTADRGWLQGMLRLMREKPRVGAAQSKIVFANTGLLNSVGVEEVEHFYYRDIAFEQPDSAQYQRPAKRQFVTGGAVMFRRECLEQVGDWDEEFILYLEDVDYSIRCREAGWDLMFAPDSVFNHSYHGVTTDALCDYFCARNRFLLVATHFPRELAACIRTSHFFSAGQFDHLYRSLLHAVARLCRLHEQSLSCEVLARVSEELRSQFGQACHDEFFFQLQLVLGLRSVRCAVLDAVGGSGEGAQVASLCRELFPGAEVTVFEQGVSDNAGGLFDLAINVSGERVKMPGALRALSCVAQDAGPALQLVAAGSDRRQWQPSIERCMLEIIGVDALPRADAEAAQ